MYIQPIGIPVRNDSLTYSLQEEIITIGNTILFFHQSLPAVKKYEGAEQGQERVLRMRTMVSADGRKLLVRKTSVRA